MEFTEQHSKQISETHDIALELKTVLLGKNSDKGLVGKVSESCDKLEEIEKDHNKLKRQFWLVVGLLVGSGVLGGGIYGLIQAL